MCFLSAVIGGVNMAITSFFWLCPLPLLIVGIPSSLSSSLTHETPCPSSDQTHIFASNAKIQTGQVLRGLYGPDMKRSIAINEAGKCSFMLSVIECDSRIRCNLTGASDGDGWASGAWTN